MHSYSYKKDSSSNVSLLSRLKQDIFNGENITSDMIKKHANLLILQTSLLVLLAILGLSVELKASISESQIPAMNNPKPLAEKNRETKVVEPYILGETSEIAVTPSEESPETTADDAAMPVEPTSYPKPPRDEYIIAIYGDSMVDTMGERLEYLEHELKTRYPDTQFYLYNYGKGSNNVLDGLERFKKPFIYQDRNYRPISQIDPDIIIMGSFAYNVFTPHDRNAHWLGYTHLIQEAQKITPNVYMLAEIAPRRSGFGFGPNGVNWEPVTAFEHTGKIIEQLENVIGLSKTLNVPLIDAYIPSFAEDRKEGKAELINPSDNIHPSIEGHEFIAKIIADSIELPE